MTRSNVAENAEGAASLAAALAEAAKAAMADDRPDAARRLHNVSTHARRLSEELSALCAQVYGE